MLRWVSHKAVKGAFSSESMEIPANHMRSIQREKQTPASSRCKSMKARSRFKAITHGGPLHGVVREHELLVEGVHCLCSREQRNKHNIRSTRERHKRKQLKGQLGHSDPVQGRAGATTGPGERQRKASSQRQAAARTRQPGQRSESRTARRNSRNGLELKLCVCSDVRLSAARQDSGSAQY